MCFTEVVSRLSPRCCERLVEGQAVSVLYQLIRSCNRSIPHMEIIKYTISILLNLAKVSSVVIDRDMKFVLEVFSI